MSIVCLIFKQKMVLNIPIFKMQGKMQFSNNSINCLCYGTLHRVSLRPKQSITQNYS